MNALVVSLKEMVGKAELAEFFRDDPESVLDFIEMLGSERDRRIAHHLPFRGRVDVLWDALQRQLKNDGK